MWRRPTAQITLTFDEPVLCSSTESVNATSVDFAVSFLGSSAMVTDVACSGTASTTIVLTTSSAPSAGQEVTVTALSDPDGSPPAFAADELDNINPETTVRANAA